MEQRESYQPDVQLHDLMLLQHEMTNDLLRQGYSHLEILAELNNNLEQRHAALLSYADDWDAMAAAQRKAHYAQRVLVRAWALRAADIREEEESTLEQDLRFNAALEALYAALEEV